MSDQEPLLSGFVAIATVALELGVHIRTLKRWKNLQYGPPSVSIGKRVFYRRADIQAWLSNLGQASKKTRSSRS